MKEKQNLFINTNEVEEFELKGIRKKTIEELVENFPYEKQDAGLMFKINEMLVILNKIYTITKSEVAGVFNFNEALLIIQTFNGYGYSEETPDKFSLLANVEDSIFLNGYDEEFNVDKNKLLEKLNKLTQGQSFAVIRMAFEVLYNERNKPLSNNFEELVKEIFGIK